MKISELEKLNVANSELVVRAEETVEKAIAEELIKEDPKNSSEILANNEVK